MSDEIIAGVSEDAAEETTEETTTAEESTSDADAEEEAGEGTDEAGDTSETEGESDEDKHKRLSGYQRTKRKLQKAEQEREFWRTEALRSRTPEPAKQEPEAPPPPAELKAPTKPKQEDFETWELFEAAKDQYVEDLSEYKAQKAIEGERQRQREDQQRQKLSTELEAARGRYQDFDKVAGPTLKTLMNDKTIHEVVRTAIGNSPMFADLLYVIGSESKEAKALLETARRDPIAAVEQIGVLKRMIAEERASQTSRTKAPPPEGDDEEAELEEAEEESAETARPPDKKPAVTRAPEPIPPVRKGAPVAKSIHDKNLPYGEYVKLRDAGKSS